MRALVRGRPDGVAPGKSVNPRIGRGEASAVKSGLEQRQRDSGGDGGKEEAGKRDGVNYGIVAEYGGHGLGIRRAHVGRDGPGAQVYQLVRRRGIGRIRFSLMLDLADGWAPGR